MLTEIESETIGEMVMEKLKEIDEISYVRFASVYRQFKDINTFLEEIFRSCLWFFKAIFLLCKVKSKLNKYCR